MASIFLRANGLTGSLPDVFSPFAPSLVNLELSGAGGALVQARLLAATHCGACSELPYRSAASKPGCLPAAGLPFCRDDAAGRQHPTRPLPAAEPECRAPAVQVREQRSAAGCSRGRAS